jgi:hypothetical protein
MTEVQSVSLSWYQGTIMGPATNLSFTSMENIFKHLRLSSCAVPSLTRGLYLQVSVQVLLGIASDVTLRSKSGRTKDHILLSHLRLGCLTVTPYVSQNYGGGILCPLHTMFLELHGTDHAESIASLLP